MIRQAGVESCTKDMLSELSEGARLATAAASVGGTEIFVLGVSHVSKTSCDHVREVINTVKPDVVMIELCKDRTDLLIDEDSPPRSWHARRVLVGDYPVNSDWPSQQGILALLQCQTGIPVGAEDIEDDVMTLLSTGLFGSVMPLTTPSRRFDAPSFVRNPDGTVHSAAPLNAIQFSVTPRMLPNIKEFGVLVESEDVSIGDTTVAGLKQSVMAKARDGIPTIDILMFARAQLLRATSQTSQRNIQVAVEFSGVDDGRIQAVMRTDAGGRCGTGLERTTYNGEGIGIRPYRRQTRSPALRDGAGMTYRLGDKSKKTSSDEKSLTSETAQNGGSKNPADLPKFIPYDTDASIGAGSNDVQNRMVHEDHRKKDPIEQLARFLTQRYGERQAVGGRKAGVSPGEAWRVAVEAAMANESALILLGDQPSSKTGRALAEGLWISSCPWFLGASFATLATGIVASGSLESVQAALACGLVGTATFSVALWPLIAPLREIDALSKLSASDIEEAVRVREPLEGSRDPYFLWGEDALLKWPGALSSVLEDRDMFMARVLKSGTEKKDSITPPALVKTVDGSRLIYRYAMPMKPSDPTICPAGAGEGVYEPLQARRIVAVVGTAHVRGILDYLSSDGDQ